jgi:hypothetical protein
MQVGVIAVDRLPLEKLGNKAQTCGATHNKETIMFPAGKNQKLMASFMRHVDHSDDLDGGRSRGRQRSGLKAI